MVEVSNYTQKVYPANLQTFGHDDGRPPSGYFSLHFTYPDTAYEDNYNTQWAKDGSNQLGVNFLIRTPLANDTTATNTGAANGEDARTGTNTVVIDLKRAAEAHATLVAAGGSMPAKTFDLGTEEAARLIAASINSSRNRQLGAHSRSRYLRARYVKMSGAPTYQFTNTYQLRFATGGTRQLSGLKSSATYLKGSTRKITLSGGIPGSGWLPNEKLYTTDDRYIGKIQEINADVVYFYEPIATDLATNQLIRGGWMLATDIGNWGLNQVGGDTPELGLHAPTDIPQKGTIVGTATTTKNDSGGNPVSGYTLTYDGCEQVSPDYYRFNITKVENSGGAVADILPNGTVSNATDMNWTVNNETKEQHTVVVSWEIETPTGGGYWGTANGGPVVQGLGAPLPVWYLTAKPMDGGNLGLPALNYDSRGATPNAHTTAHGYSRFSVEGLNSCILPDLPPPDKPFDGPVIAGSTEADPFQWTGQTSNLGAEAKDELLVADNEFSTKMDSAGPYEANCVVSTNATLSSGTTIKVLAPSTNLQKHFKEDDYIYKSDGTQVGQIASIALTHNTGLQFFGPKNESTGIRVATTYLRSDRDKGSKMYNPEINQFEAGVNEHNTGDLSTIKIDGGDAPSLFSLGDKVFTAQDLTVGTLPISRLIRRRNKAGTKVLVAKPDPPGSGNTYWENQDTFEVDTLDPNLLYQPGERLYSMGTASTGWYNAVGLTFQDTVAAGAATSITVAGGDPGAPDLPGGQFAQEGWNGSAYVAGSGFNIFNVGDEVLTTGGNRVGVIASIEGNVIHFHGPTATTVNAGNTLMKRPYLGKISEIAHPVHATAHPLYSAAAHGSGTTTTIQFEQAASGKASANASDHLVVGQELYDAGINLVGVITSIDNATQVTLAANNATAISLGEQFKNIEKNRWAIKLTAALPLNQHLGENDEIMGESITPLSLTFADTGGDGTTAGLTATTLRNDDDKQDTLYRETINYVSGVGADYTASHFNDPNGARKLVVVDTSTTKASRDQEVIGIATASGNMATYGSSSVGNPAQLLNQQGEVMATTTGTTTTGTTVGSNTYSDITLNSISKTMTTTDSMWRSCAVITLKSAISGTTLADGEMLFKASKENKWQVALENGYTMNAKFPSLENGYENDYSNSHQHTHISNLTNSNQTLNKAIVKNGLKSEVLTITASADATIGSQGYVNRPYRVVRTVNTERVKGLVIPNEARVWDNIEVEDDSGQKLVLEGGSPFGTVIKDYQIVDGRIDPNTGQVTNDPSTPGRGIEPNMRVQIPSQYEIPGNILVKAGHDRIQAWRNLTWGMGGLSPPRPDEPGIIEANSDPYDNTAGSATQFDTNDRVLHFHPVRILHNSLTTHFGLTTMNTPGAVPSGSTRLFSAHRLSDHAERGSVLMETENGADGDHTHPHHRIRFGRQGHNFATPLLCRGTPISMRRQLHRSHGSAYSLMYEGESENKHWGFQSANTNNDADEFFLDTLEVESHATNTGSFSSDGLPLGEVENNGLPNHRRFYGSAPKDKYDVLLAPGQEHTLVEGSFEQAHFVSDFKGTGSSYGGYSNTAHSGPLALQLATTISKNNRFNSGSEFCINGFFLNDYHLMGGRPRPSLTSNHHLRSISTPYFYSITGHHAGWIQPRVGTELGTVPPLFGHDPEMLNASATPISVQESPSSSGHFTQTSDHNDLGLVKASETASGATPDAFLCTWLAEYSHPALFGTNREQFMTFRYREAGMPKSVDYPAVRGLLLRNASIGTKTVGTARIADPFERLYAFQWLQNFGYNGLNAGGHGNAWGLRATSAVLMGHTTVREAHGTIQLSQHFTRYGNTKRYSRGEGIGDGLNPNKTISRAYTDKDATNSYVWGDIITMENPMVAIDWSRRLPVRAWGFKTANSAENMLAGDPTEVKVDQMRIQASGRFDGGIHDSMNTLPVGNDWQTVAANTGVERSVPIGFVMSEHTNEAIGSEGYTRLTNEAWTKGEKEVGMGRVLQLESNGMVKPTAMPAGVMTSHRTEFTTVTGASAKFLHAKSVNTGSDPIIGLNHHSGQAALASDSIEAVTQTVAFGGSGFIHQKGNNLHINAHPVDYAVNSGDLKHFPAHGWGQTKDMKNQSGASERGVMPIPLSEITDHRQVQSDLSPRLGMVVETNSERATGKNEDYVVTSTKAVSLHSDLAIGQQFPVMPSWVQQTKWTKYGKGATTAAANPDATYGGPTAPNQKKALPQWSLNRNPNLGATSNSDTSKVFDGAGVYDHWAVRGCGDLPAWGGVFILRKTWLERPEERQDIRRSELGGSSGKVAVEQPVRRTTDYIMRMVRPLKVFGFTTATDHDGTAGFTQDGWLLGAYSSLTQAGFKQQPFTRDKRYGMFELNHKKMPSTMEPITSPYDTAPLMEWPDANERDVTWHLIPSANMLQHFKSDASRTDREGRIHPLVDARYSQSTHPGGLEVVSQSETNYATNATVVNDPYNRRERDEVAQVKQPDYTMTTLGAKAKIEHDGGSKLYVDSAIGFPASGTLVILGLTGNIPYTARTEDYFTIGTATGQCSSISDLKGYELRLGKNASVSVASTIANIHPSNHSLVVAPSFVDNAVSVALLLNDKWDATDSTDTNSYSPNINYRGLGHYEPSDFNMLTPQRFMLNDGQGEGVLQYVKRPGTGGLSTIYVDGAALTTATCPTYLLDAINKRWRIAGARIDTGHGDKNDHILNFRNISAESLSGSGMSLNEPVRLGHFMSVGVRTSDAALLMLDDLDSAIPGADLVPFDARKEAERTDTGIYGAYVDGGSVQSSKVATLSSFLNAHPLLASTNDHSGIFVSTKAKGVGVLDVLRSLSQMDGKQLVLDEGGLLLYTSNVFVGKERRVGSSSGPQTIEVSQMMEMANEVIVQGDTIAENESIVAKVRDGEKIKKMGGANNEKGVVRTATQSVPGLRDSALALRMAKRLMNRTEQGAAMIRVTGLLKSTDIAPGEIVHVDFTMERINGQFVVFETFTNYKTGTTDLVIGQYEKGIEGLLADLQASIDISAEEDPKRTKERIELSMNAPIRVLASSRVLTRLVNNSRFIIGGRWRGSPTTHQLGAIGVKGGATGVIKNGTAAATSTTNLAVDGVDATTRFSANDLVFTLAGEYVGVVSSVTPTSVVLAANNAVEVANDVELRVSSIRADPVGHSKSVFYEVR